MQDTEKASPQSMWSLYLEEKNILDAKLAERWKGQLDSILIFAGLFSSTVGAFILESYKTLKPDNGDAVVDLLTKISQQLSTISNETQSSSAPIPPYDSSYSPPAPAIRVNILWIMSLMLSLTAAFGAIVVQQCTRDYLTMQSNQQRNSQLSPHTQARIHVHLLYGAELSLLAYAPDLLGALIHSSLFLFFAGLVSFLSDINTIVYRAVLGITIAVSVLYTIISVLPLISTGIPYSTPLTWVWRRIWGFIYCVCVVIIFPMMLVSMLSEGDLSTLVMHLTFSLAMSSNNPTSQAIMINQSFLDKQILLRTMLFVHVDETKLETFFAALAEFLQSKFVEHPEPIVKEMLRFRSINGVDARFNILFMTALSKCVDRNPHPEQDVIRVRRATTVISSVWQVMVQLRDKYPSIDWWLSALSCDLEASAVDSLVKLTNDHVPVISLAARSLIVLAVHTTHKTHFQPSESPLDYLGSPNYLYGSLRKYMDYPTSLRIQFEKEEDTIRNAYLIYTTRFVHRVLPYLTDPSTPECDLVLTWHTLDIITSEVTEPIQADAPVCGAFMDLWMEVNARERMMADNALPFAPGRGDMDSTALCALRLGLLISMLLRVRCALKRRKHAGGNVTEASGEGSKDDGLDIDGVGVGFPGSYGLGSRWGAYIV